MNLVQNLKQFLFASLVFTAVVTIHLNITGSLTKASEFAKKDTQQIELSAEKFALNTLK